MIPGSIFSRNTTGSNALIRNGAAPITTSEELLQELGLATAEKAAPVHDVTKKEAALLATLIVPTPRDELFAQLGISAQEGAVLLVTLELKGYIKEVAGEVHNLTL